MKKYAFLLVLPLLWGCDVLSGNETYDVRGHVVNAQTGQPIEGVFVSLGTTHFGSTVLAWDETSEDGSFRVRYTTDDDRDLDFSVNDYSLGYEYKYNKCYSSFVSINVRDRFEVSLDPMC